MVISRSVILWVLFCSIVQSSVLIVLPVSNSSAAIDNLLILREMSPLDDAVDLLACNEEYLDFLSLNKIRIRKQYFSRFVCDGYIEDFIASSNGFEDMVEAMRLDVIRGAMNLKNDVDILLSAVSKSSIIIADTTLMKDIFMRVVHVVLQSSVITTDIIENFPSSTLRVWRQVKRPLYTTLENNFTPRETKYQALVDIANNASRYWVNGEYPDSDCNCGHQVNSSRPQCYELNERTLLNVQHFKVHSINRTVSTSSESTVVGTAGVLTQSSVKKLLLCMVYTITPRHNNLRAVIDTWGKRCDGFIAWSNDTDVSLSAVYIYNIRLNGSEAYDAMWYKVIGIWEMVAASPLIDQYEYFYLCGDDTYVIVNNLRQYLMSDFIRQKAQNGRMPVYLGRKVVYNRYLNYNTGESGYILNARAVQLLVQHLKTEECFYDIKVSMEDVMVANCLLSTIGLKAIDTRDTSGKERFLFANLSTLLVDGENDNRHEAHLKHIKLLLEGYSQYAVSFHLMTPNDYVYCVDQYLQEIV